MRVSGELTSSANKAFSSRATIKTSKARANERRDLSPLTLRITREERERLETLAAGMTLSAYVRACVFGEEAKRRKRRPKNAVEDKKAIAEALALLGQSRLANNLNQLAYHANIGALDIGESERAKIDESYRHVIAIRALLVRALGVSGAPVQGCETAASRFARTRSHRDHLGLQGDSK